MIDKMTMPELLGPFFEKNLCFIKGALSGQQQVFERDILLPTGEMKKSIATYYPDFKNGTVQGFFVHVADVTMVKKSYGMEASPVLHDSDKFLNNELLEQITDTLRQHIYKKFPGINALSKKHFLSTTKLKTDFKSRYGTTLMVFFRDLQWSRRTNT